MGLLALRFGDIRKPTCGPGSLCMGVSIAQNCADHDQNKKRLPRAQTHTITNRTRHYTVYSSHDIRLNTTYLDKCCFWTGECCR